MSPSLPKKNFLALLSIPIISNPLLAKKTVESEPTKPHDPVINAIFIKKTFLIFYYYSAI